MISANYFDGASARLHPVDLDLGEGRFALAGAGIRASYPYAEARMAEPFGQAPCVIDFADGARCEVSDAAGKAAIGAALGYRQSRVVRLQQHWYGALLALALLVASIGAFVVFGMPALADRVVASLPATVDQRIGDEALRAMTGRLFTPSRLSEQRIAEIDDIFRSIQPKRTRIPLHLLVASMSGRAPNAFALPNGTIVMTDQMILVVLAGAAEFDADKRAAIAGILAHEIGHIEGRHSMRAIVRSSMLALGSAALFGDFSNVVAGAPVLLLNMDYSRNMEAAADAYAIVRMDQAGMSTAPLADLFDALEKLAPGQSALPKWMNKNLSYLRSHPASAERSARFRAGRHYDD
jgi:Zn-dependent protease with chaperone function